MLRDSVLAMLVISIIPLNIVLAVISNPGPNSGRGRTCCIDGIELPPPDNCESTNDPFFGLHNDGYCEDSCCRKAALVAEHQMTAIAASAGYRPCGLTRSAPERRFVHRANSRIAVVDRS